MNFIRLLVIFLFVFPFMKVQGQNRIIPTSKHLNDTVQGKTIKTIQLSWGYVGKKIKVTYADGTDTLINRSSLWGFQKIKEPVMRIFEGRPYELLEVGPIIIYKSSNVNGSMYFFSTDLNSDLKPLNQRKLIKEIGDENYLKAMKTSALLRKLID